MERPPRRRNPLRKEMLPVTKRKKNKDGKGWFDFLKRDTKKKTAPSPRTRKKKDAPLMPSWLWVMLTIIGFALLGAGLTAGFMYMERYVKTLPQTEENAGPLKLINPPSWLGQAWTDHIIDTVGGSRFPLNESAARSISERLGKIPWLSDVRVQTTPTNLEISAQYRRPIVKATVAGRSYYVDEKMVVFQALPVTTIAVPEVIGFTQRSVPPAGSVWLAEDAKAGMELIYILSLMDLQMMTAAEPIQKPLLDEIDSIDVTNFAGRKNAGQPHLVLNVKDGTKVHWGAAWGQAARLLEADEKEKITTLYQHYTENKNTLQGKVKFIELRQPQTLIPRPQ